MSDDAKTQGDDARLTGTRASWLDMQSALVQVARALGFEGDHFTHTEVVRRANELSHAEAENAALRAEVERLTEDDGGMYWDRIHGENEQLRAKLAEAEAALDAWIEFDSGRLSEHLSEVRRIIRKRANDPTWTPPMGFGLARSGARARALGALARIRT